MATSSGPDVTVAGLQSTNGLDVLMDITFADAIDLSARQVKERLEAVLSTAKEVKTLETKLNEIERTLEDNRYRLQEHENDRDQIQKQLEGTTDEVKKLDNDLKILNEMFERYNEDVEEQDNEEPGIAIEDQLRITEQSAKAIDLLSSHLLSTVWQTCSKNSFGFYIRIMLLSGSQFKKQLIPETAPLIILGFLTVLFSAAMQIILAYYLWTRLPPSYPKVNGDNVELKQYSGTADGRSYYNWYSPLLPAFQYPNYMYANDVCRTVPIVQPVTIGLFLFSILNNIPGVIKNFHIIWNSDRFISVDEDGITKLHYWRESRYSREPANMFLNFLVEDFCGRTTNFDFCQQTSKCQKLEEAKDEISDISKSIQLGVIQKDDALKSEPEKVSELALAVLKVEARIKKIEEQELEEEVAHIKRLEDLKRGIEEHIEKIHEDRFRQDQIPKPSQSTQDSMPDGLGRNNVMPQVRRQGRAPADSNSNKGTVTQMLAPPASYSSKTPASYSSKPPEAQDTHDSTSNEGQTRQGPTAPEDTATVLRRASAALGVAEDDVIPFLCEMYLCGSVIHKSKEKDSHKSKDEDEYKSYAGAARRRWMLTTCFTKILSQKSWQQWLLSWMPSCCKQRGKVYGGIVIPKSFFEVCETRSFLAEALRLMDQANNTKKAGIVKDLTFDKEPLQIHFFRENIIDWPPSMDFALWPREIQFCDQVRLNLVRMDYLRPSKWTRPHMDKWLSKHEIIEDEREIKKLVKALLSLKRQMENLEKVEENMTASMGKVIKKLETRMNELKELHESVKMLKIDEHCRMLLPNSTSMDVISKWLKDMNIRLKALLKFNTEVKGDNELQVKGLGVFQKLKVQMKDKRNVMAKALHSLISDQQIKKERENIKCKCLRSKHFISCCCPNPSKAKESVLLDNLHNYLGRDFADVLTSVAFSDCCPSMMIPFRVLAFTFGVLPELFSLAFMAVAGVQYILWSGFKVGSDTQGMEEIILATLAINFIYEIDDAVYDHVLPELYKEAHERDRFDITGYWISAETTAILDKCSGAASNWWWHKLQQCCLCSTKRTETEMLVEEEDCLKKLRRCEPIVYETASSKFLEGGSAIRGVTTTVKKNIAMMVQQQDENLTERQETEESVEKTATNSPPISGSVVFIHPTHDESCNKKKFIDNQLNAGSEQAEHWHADAGGLTKAAGSVDLTEKINLIWTICDEELLKDNEQKTKDDIIMDIHSVIKCAQDESSTETVEYTTRWKQNFENAVKNGKNLSDDWNDWDAKKKDPREYGALTNCLIADVESNPCSQGSVESKNCPQAGGESNRLIHGSPFVRAINMSVTDHWNDVYLAHAYPFLYARKLRYAFARHLWERFLVFYGMWGMHLVMLIVITIAIVGGYRTMARCDRFAAKGDEWLGVFAKQEWPNVCVLNVGNQSHQSFAALENATAEELLAVSCGVNGYVPGKAEWARNHDYFAPPPPP